MNLFEILPENLFSILASKNKKVYIDALFVLRKAFEQEMVIAKQALIVMLISNMEDEILKANFEEEAEDKMTNSLSDKAHFILRRLKWAGWIEFEMQDTTFEEHVILPDYAIEILNTFYSLTTQKQMEYNSYAYVTYSILKVAIENITDEQLYNAVQVAYTNTHDLVLSLKSLHHNLGRYYKKITKIENINGILEEHFENYKEYIDKIYHPLKTTDPVDMYRIPIKKMVERILGNSDLFEELIKEAMKTNRYSDREEAEMELVMKLGEIGDTFENIHKKVGEVERKNNEYIRATIKKIGYLLSSDKELKGKLINILKQSKDAKVLEEMQNGISLYKQSYLDKDSVYLRSSKSEKKQGKPLPISFQEIEGKEELNEFMHKIQNSYSSQRIKDYMLQLFKDKPVITDKDISINNEEEFILLMLGIMNEDRSFYKIEYNNLYIVVNGYRIPQMKLKKKGE